MSAVGAGLTKRGWVAGYVTEPSGLHHMLNLTHEPVVGRYLDDLAAAIREAPAPEGQAVRPLAQY